MAFYGSTGNGPLHEGVEMSTDPGEGWEPRYRATIVPDKKNEWDGGTLCADMTEEELIQFIRDYGICNGIRDLTDAANALDRIRKTRK